MTSFSFIHAADINLDSPLSGLSAYEGAPVDLLRNAPRAAFSNLIDEAIRERVDFMVIAGDLYDGAWRDFNTGLFFSGETGRLKREEIPVFIVHGNHDAESELTIGPDHLGQIFERRFRMSPPPARSSGNGKGLAPSVSGTQGPRPRLRGMRPHSPPAHPQWPSMFQECCERPATANTSQAKDAVFHARSPS